MLWEAILEKGRMDPNQKKKKNIHCSMAKQALGWNRKGMLGSGNWLSY